MELQKAIVKMSGLIDHYFCDRVIDFLNFDDLEQMGVSNPTNSVQTDVRNVMGTQCIYNQCIEGLPKKGMTKYILYKHLIKKLNIVLMNYSIRFPQYTYSNVVQSDFLKYPEGGKYEVHIDGSANHHRILSVITNLNDDYEGGEFIFFNPSNRKEIILEEKLKKGDVLCFPSNFLYPHSVRPIAKGFRYSIVSWTV
jgi:predicted 2-oxoglutarate/Fe(II)-dependent dioxygenase YbiX